MYKKILVIIGVLILGAFGALIFNVSLLPYFLASTYFENFQFVKDFKQGKIVVNPKEQVYIQENNAIEDAVQKVQKSIVVIQSAKLTLRSGLIATSDGIIITLANAIPASGNFKVFLQGEPVNFKVVKIDSKDNLALIKIEKNNLPTISFAETDKIKLGQAVFLVASTSVQQDNWLANSGIIREISQDAIRTNILEKPVVNGSPLFNSAGELVGINFVDQPALAQGYGEAREGKISAVPVAKIQALLGL